MDMPQHANWLSLEKVRHLADIKVKLFQKGSQNGTKKALCSKEKLKHSIDMSLGPNWLSPDCFRSLAILKVKLSNHAPNVVLAWSTKLDT